MCPKALSLLGIILSDDNIPTQCQISEPLPTYDGNGFVGKSKSAQQAHVFTPATGRPQPHDILQPKKYN